MIRPLHFRKEIVSFAPQASRRSLPQLEAAYVQDGRPNRSFGASAEQKE